MIKLVYNKTHWGNLFLILLSVILLVTGCGDGNQSDLQSEAFITVDVTAKYPKEELILQDFMDVEYIQLETNDEFVTTAYIRAIGKDIIIVDSRTRAFASKNDIFIFDKNGNGIRKINRMGQGGEEYMNIGGIVFDEDNGNMFVNSNFTNKTFVYDLFGNFKWSFGHREGTFYFPLENFNQDLLIGGDGEVAYGDIVANRFLLISKQDGSVTKEIQIPYQEKKLQGIKLKDANGNTLSDANSYNQELIPYRGSWLLVEVSSDTIYKLEPNHNLTPFIVRTPSVQSMNPEVFLFPGVLTDRYYFMQTVKREFDFGTRVGFPRTDLMYDREKKTIYEYIVYNNDFTNKKTVSLGQFNRTGLTLINNEEIAFMQKLEAHELVEAYEKGQLKGKLKEIAAELDEESNPVIMIARYKK